MPIRRIDDYKEKAMLDYISSPDTRIRGWLRKLAIGLSIVYIATAGSYIVGVQNRISPYKWQNTAIPIVALILATTAWIKPDSNGQRFTMSVALLCSVFSTALASWLVVSPPQCTTGGPESLQVTCAIRMRNIGRALQFYADTHSGEYPSELLKGLDIDASDSDRFTNCPAALKAANAEGRNLGPGASLIYLGQQVQAGDPPSAILITEPLSNHDLTGANVLYKDGSVRWLDKADWQKLYAAIKLHAPATSKGTQ